MQIKLTLSLDQKIIQSAKNYSKKKGISLSKLVEFYFKSLISNEKSSYNFDKLPPITEELSGIAEFQTVKTDKELLKDALTDKFL